MAAKKTKKRKRAFGDGFLYQFHGAFTSKAKAEKRARDKGGWMVPRFLGASASSKRYVVMVPRDGSVPF